MCFWAIFFLKNISMFDEFMTRNFILTVVVFLLSVAVFYVTVTQLDPLGEQRHVAFFAFFLSIFCGVTAFFTFFFFFLHELMAQRKLGSRQFLIAMRRGLLLAVFVVVLLLLQLFRMLGLFEFAMLSTFLILVEVIFWNSEKK